MTSPSLLLELPILFVLFELSYSRIFLAFYTVLAGIIFYGNGNIN